MSLHVNGEITVDNAFSYLAAHDLLGSEAIVEGQFEASSAARRNRNVRVATAGFGSYLIKQPEAHEENRVSLRREILFYEACCTLGSAAPLRRWLPQRALSDLDRCVLVLELLEDASPLWSHYEERAAEAFPVEAAQSVGGLLGVLHDTFDGRPGHREPALASFLPESRPMVFDLHRPDPNLLGSINQPAYRVLSLLQSDAGLAGRMGALRPRWRCEAVIHGDVKLDNILVCAAEDSERRDAVYLVDWELVQWGDPAWDVAGALHDFVVLWIMTLRSAPTVEQMLEAQRFPLETWRPASHDLWHAYMTARRFAAEDADVFLRRAVAYVGARLVQSAFELALGSSSMPARSLLMLQVAANVWADPVAAGDDLFGVTASV